MKAAGSSALFDRYLRQLRAGGRTNMYGAVPYLMKTFGLDRHAAFAVVCDWLDRQADTGHPEVQTRHRSRQKVTPTPR